MSVLNVQQALAVAKSLGIYVFERKNFWRVGSPDNTKPRIYVPKAKEKFSKADVSAFSLPLLGSQLGEKKFGRVGEKLDLTLCGSDAQALEVWTTACEELARLLASPTPAPVAPVVAEPVATEA